jgi:hypothetical protein
MQVCIVDSCRVFVRSVEENLRNLLPIKEVATHWVPNLLSSKFQLKTSKYGVTTKIMSAFLGKWIDIS